MKANSHGAGGGFRRLAVTAGVLALLALLISGNVAEVSARTSEALPSPDAPGQILARGAAAGGDAPAYQAGFPLGGYEGEGARALWSGAAALAGLCLLAWTLLRARGVNDIDMPGFEIITNSEARKFIPLEEKFQQMDYLTKVKTRGALRLSANLNKVSLSFRRYGYLLEDKNFRNALLVNRRRVRRTLLRDGDVLDLGDLTLLYRDNREVPIIRHSAVTPPKGKVQIKFDRVRGPVRKGTPMLVFEQGGSRNFYITKNLIFLGRSESNDLIIKSQGVSYRHAKIERVGSRYKLLDLSGAGNTFVNNRRVEQRMLRVGDEITLDNQRFKFQLVSKYVKESTQTKFSPKDGAGQRMEGRTEDSGQGEEMPADGENYQSEAHEGSEINA